MSLFNIIWIAVFFYYAYMLIFPGIEGVDFGIWDEVVGFLLLFTALCGLYFVIKTAMKKLSDISNRARERSDARYAERRSMEYVVARPDTAPPPEGFYEDFRADIVAQGSSEQDEAVQQAPDLQEQPPAQAPSEEAVGESIHKLRQDFEQDGF